MTQIPAERRGPEWVVRSFMNSAPTFRVRHRRASVRSFRGRYSHPANPPVAVAASAAKDELGNTVHSQRLALQPTRKATRSLVQGLKGDPTYSWWRAPEADRQLRHSMRNLHPPGLRVPGTRRNNLCVPATAVSTTPQARLVRAPLPASLALAKCRRSRTTSVF